MSDKASGVSIPVISWLDRPIKKSINSVFDDLEEYTEALDVFKKYRKNHFKRLRKKNENIKILGMNEPMKLVDVYHPARVSTTVYGRLYEQEWLSAETLADVHPAERRKQKGVVRADEVIAKRDRVVILGAPGSGKTTFLKHLALAYTDKKVFADSNLGQSRFPFLISLPSFAKEREDKHGIIDYLAAELAAYTDDYAPSFVKRVVSKGGGILLLDSLDEVPELHRELVVREIDRVAEGYPECPIVISCRTADYRELFEDFYEVELARLSDNAVTRVVRAWFKDEPERAADLLRHLKRDKSVAGLCETPLLLSLLCIQFRHDLSLPQRKSELYRRCIDAFLRDWDARRGFRRDSAYSTLSDDRKERIFEDVAGRFFFDEIRLTFPETEVTQYVAESLELYEIPREKASDVLREIEAHHGILERFSADSFAFSHPSFQEYFAARDILSKRCEMATLKEHIQDEGWGNVIEFMVAMSSDPSAMLLFLQAKSELSSIKNYPPMARRARILWLLYRCLAAGAAIDKETRASLYAHIINSHFQMGGVFSDSGVFPVPVLMEDGVRHAYVYYHKRPTLHQALQPLRLLANEVLLNPTSLYADLVVDRLRDVKLSGGVAEELATATNALCLAVPIAWKRPKAVRRIMEKVRSAGGGLVERMVQESLSFME